MTHMLQKKISIFILFLLSAAAAWAQTITFEKASWSTDSYTDTGLYVNVSIVGDSVYVNEWHTKDYQWMSDPTPLLHSSRRFYACDMSHAEDVIASRIYLTLTNKMKADDDVFSHKQVLFMKRYDGFIIKFPNPLHDNLLTWLAPLSPENIAAWNALQDKAKMIELPVNGPITITANDLLTKVLGVRKCTWSIWEVDGDYIIMQQCKEPKWQGDKPPYPISYLGHEIKSMKFFMEGLKTSSDGIMYDSREVKSYQYWFTFDKQSECNKFKDDLLADFKRSGTPLR